MSWHRTMRVPSLATASTVAATLALAARALASPMNVSLSFASLASAQGFTYSATGSHAGVPEAGFATGSLQYDFGLTPTRISTLNSGGTVLLSGTYDNTQFHDYVLEFTPPGTFRIYRDGALLLTSTSGYPLGVNRIFLGDGTGGANARGEITYFQFIQDLATPALAGTWGRLKGLYR